MREIARLALGHFTDLDIVGIDLFGDEVILSCVLGQLSGIIPCTLERIGEPIPFPEREPSPIIDGFTSTQAVLRESFMVIWGEAGATGLLGIYDRALRDWRVFTRDEVSSWPVAAHAQGSSHAISLNETGAQPEFELIDLTGSRSVGRIPSRQSETPECIALSPALTHVAMAQDDAVVCMSLGGEVERSWPKSESFFDLSFAEDDVVSTWRDGFIVHRRDGGVNRFSLPNMRPLALDAARRTAMFRARQGREYIEFDLSTGRHSSRGVLPAGDFLDVDLRSRRVAVWDDEEQQLRVFEMPP